MGKVYKAHNTNLDKTCAIKILPPDFAEQDQSAITRFIREARSAAAIQNPNVLPVHFVGKVGQNYFIEMEYVDGGTLQGLLKKQGKLDVKQAAQIIRDVAMGLQAAHEKGIIHRDIKPTNVMLTTKGHVYVMDFGLAKVAQARTGLTVSGAVMGTPLYMSPEQATGQPVDQRSDIYSLGVMFYQLITGTPPFTADSPVGILYQHQHAPIPDIAQAVPETTPLIAAIIRRMMAKDPKDRYQSCAEVAQELNEFLISPDRPALVVSESVMREADDHHRDVLTKAKGGATAKVPRGKGRVTGGKRRAAGVAAAIAVVVLLLGAAGIYFVSGRHQQGSGFGVQGSGTEQRPATEPKGDEGFIPLFNGKDLTGWRLRDNKKPNRWSAQDGLLVNTPPSDDLVTEQKFSDFEFHCEYKIPPKGNSGVFLRGRYEVQILDDFGQAPTKASSGGILPTYRPERECGQAPDEWQTLDVTLVGKKLTVVLNGRTVIADAELRGPTVASSIIRRTSPAPSSCKAFSPPSFSATSASNRWAARRGVKAASTCCRWLTRRRTRCKATGMLQPTGWFWKAESRRRVGPAVCAAGGIRFRIEFTPQAGARTSTNTS